MNYVQQIDLDEKIKATVEQMSTEFIREHGYITCEFSIQEKYVVAMHNYIHIKNRDLPEYGMWRIFMCEVCSSHNPEYPYHVEITVIDERPTFTE